MRISRLAVLTGVSARALRHYEDRGLLVPARDPNGYRAYAETDVLRVARIRTMIAAGLGTAVIHRYLDCATSGEDGVVLEMCPGLRAELDALAERLDAEETRIRRTRQRLAALASARTVSSPASPVTVRGA
ncbi:MerR family transcriptional regulator [Streptomyces sp. NPDC057682]|uniref:MerR family transcriptional regulator n=1 Tax=Streptomyces sp. NPDC057682 TaxID=3346210 RepID=UPI0036C21E5C